MRGVSEEHEDEHLVADLGVSSVERYAALRLCGESIPLRLERSCLSSLP